MRAAALAAALAVAAVPALAEIEADDTRSGHDRPPAGPVHVQCYQHGVKVVDEHAVPDFAISPAAQVVGRTANARRSLTVVESGSALCVVKSE